MSTDALIHDLSSGLAPVRRRRPLREAAALLAIGIAELGSFLGLGMMRPDMGAMIASPYMIWKLGSLAVLAGVGGAIAVRSFSPIGKPRRDFAILLVLALAVAAGGLFVVPGDGSGRALVERLAPAHGLLCAAAIVVLSMPMLAMLAMLMRSAAPTHPRGSALAAGLAAAGCGAFVFAFCCPVNDPLYIVVWYSAGCAVVAAFARWLLPRRFRL